VAKKKKSVIKKSTSSLTSLWLSLTSILSLVGGTGVSGWVNPDLPVIGPIVASFMSTPGDSSSAAPPGSPAGGMQPMQPGVMPAGNVAGAGQQWGAASPTTPAVPQRPMPPGSPPLASISYAPAVPPPPPPPPPTAGGKPPDALLVCSFNIQVFGESKLAKPEVVAVLARVVRMFDIVAIQEVRAKSDSVVPTFVQAVNADGSRYHWVIGPRLGRTVSKEQYTFVYDTGRVEVDPSSVGTAPNPGDKMHRPPMFARFRTRANPPESAFTFWMVDIHTDPDEVPQEVDALADVFVAMQHARPDEDDVILLGDLNAAPNQFGRITQIPNIGWAVSGTTTNTRRNKTYDNIIFSRAATAEYLGRWGVLDLQSTFGLSLDDALKVSDHNPVWAAFSPWEIRR
jgi:endonuclease/exonuclease/phosphatase family metal-dependent hydrolase